MRIRAPKDFWSGLMFCGFAAVGILAARGYSLGAAGKMGPGYFPLLLGLVLGALGAILIPGQAVQLLVFALVILLLIVRSQRQRVAVRL